MILGELYDYYRRMEAQGEGDMPKRGWSKEKVVWELPIDAQGKLKPPVYLGGEGKGAQKFVYMTVPEHPTRSGTKPAPFFLCDTAAYILGLEEKRGAEKRSVTAELHLKVLEGCAGVHAEALRRFFEQDNPAASLDEATCAELAKVGNCIISFEDGSLAHADSEIVHAWEHHLMTANDEGEQGQCAVTGEQAPLARLFPQVTGIPGAQSSGASLVSFNCDAFESYGRTQGYNASLSEDVAFGAGAALKQLFQDERHRIRLGSMTVLFWADRKAPQEDAFMLLMLGGKQQDDGEDEDTLNAVAQAIDSIRTGHALTSINASTKYCILGISPNAARLSVRFFEMSTLGALADNYGQYLRDVEMVGCRTSSLYHLLLQTAPPSQRESNKQLPETLIHPSFRAMLHGTVFPSSLETLLLARMRADRATQHTWDMSERAALMKACLLRKHRRSGTSFEGEEGEITVALNRENDNVGYLLGRLFAVMERAQEGALDNINATIRDKYMGTAAVTPNRVYPTLMGMCQKHLGALRRDTSKAGLARMLEREFDSIYSMLPGSVDGIPASLSVDDQMLFYIGYYQQRTDLWTSRKNKELAADNVSNA